MAQAIAERRSDIDWLRVIAFSLLILYHAGMPYVEWDWHIKDLDRWYGLQEVMRFVSRWRMPLIFLLAGATVMLSLGRRSAGAFVRDRLKRILLPLVFGILVLVPPQVYLQRAQEGEVEGSFLAFYPHFFDGIYPDGNFSWHHLWFLAYVLVLALLLLPAWLWMRSARGARILDRGSAFVARYHLAGLVVLPLFAIEVLLLPISPNRNGLIGDWYGLAFYGFIMLLGALLYRSPALLQSLERQRFAALAAALLAYVVLEAVYFAGPIKPPYDLSHWYIMRALSALSLTGMLLAIVGFAHRWARPTAFLRYATPAVYPFYMLHQTITAIAAYYLVASDMPVQLKYAALVVVTFGGCALIYEFAIRRSPWLRLLFGISETLSLDRTRTPATLSADRPV